MLAHPILNALFNESVLVPSKQLQALHQRLRDASLEPSIVIVLPPIELLKQYIDSETFYHDSYLLSHVASVNWANLRSSLITFNGGNWALQISNTQVLPAQGFPLTSSTAANIKTARMWSPGFPQLRFNATFLILETDGLLLANDTPRRFSIFASPATSTPIPRAGGDSKSTLVDAHIWSRTAPTALEAPSPPPPVEPKSRQMKNPAADLGRTRSQREENMAKVDYSLACLQQDVASAAELAERFHKAVFTAQKALTEAGAEFIELQDGAESETPGFTTRLVYDYAEIRLARYILTKLDNLLALERTDVPFPQVQEDLQSLDLCQVDIPGLEGVNVAAYERAIAKSASTLNQLSSARDSSTICQVFLQSLKDLSNPALGTVSADTLLGLFMLSLLRTSSETAAVIERNLYFVMHFSFLSAEANQAHVSAGRLSYTLMVVQSVLLQLRIERTRLKPIAELNRAVWTAVDNDDRPALQRVYENNASALQSRKCGESVLFLTIGKGSASLLHYLLQSFPSIISKEFVLRDRDMYDRTLLMASLHDTSLTTAILDVVGEDCDYFAAADLKGHTVAHDLQPPTLQLVVDRVGPLFNWTKRDLVSDDTPLLKLARQGLLSGVLRFCNNFFEHIDHLGNSLLHMVVNSEPKLLSELLRMPSCDVNWVNRAGYTPLMVAVLETSIELLLEAGADAWYFDISDAQQTSSAALRRRWSSMSESNPLVQNTHRPNERFIFQPAGRLVGVRKVDDFQTLVMQLRTMFPHSWLPRLEWLYADLKNTGIGHHLFGTFLWDDAFRIGYWLRLTWHHGSFKSSAPLLEFYGAESRDGAAADTPTHKRASSNLEHEEIVSITSFCQFSIEQLSTLEASLKHFMGVSLVVQEARDEDASATTGAQDDLAGLAQLMRSDFRAPLVYRASSSLQRETHVVFDQLVKSTVDLQHSFHRPIALAQEHAQAKAQLKDSREKLEAIAGSKASPSWLRPESKRVAEIQALEDGVSSARTLTASLESRIRETHLALATEFSAFNVFQENEILDQLRKSAQHRLQAARDELRRLDYAFEPQRKRS